MTLEDLRDREGLNTYQMAERLGITQGHYCHLENGSRKLTDSIAGKISSEFGISKEQIKKDFVLSNPHLDVINSWIWKIKIEDKPVIQSFIDNIGFLKISNTSENGEVLEAFIKYIQFNIGNSIKNEFKVNDNMIEYLTSRLKK